MGSSNLREGWDKCPREVIGQEGGFLPGEEMLILQSGLLLLS